MDDMEYFLEMGGPSKDIDDNFTTQSGAGAFVPTETSHFERPGNSEAALHSINTRLDEMNRRMDNIETALNRLLSLFGIPAVTSTPNISNALDASVPSRNRSCSTTSASELVPVNNNTGTDPPLLKSALTETLPAPDKSAVNADRSHRYWALDSSKSEIRVLALHRSETLADPIVAELTIQSLDDMNYGVSFKPYTALSYTWGPPVFDGSIQLNGHRFAVTRNLEMALRYMRLHNEVFPMHAATGTYWWIDQICINQANMDERNGQVALMRRIYKRASSVFVWLGEEADDSSTALDLLNVLGAPPTHAPGEKAIEYPSFTQNEVLRHWVALEALFKRPWWERVWIRQEIALSAVVTLVCGKKTCSMDSLGPALTALNYVQSLGYEVPLSQSPLDDSTFNPHWTFHARQLSELRQCTNGGYTWVELDRLLPGSRACKATDARDTVFSLLGLADAEIYPVIADYRHELKDVLTAVTRSVITKEYGLDVLGACQNPEKRYGLPSWVPNLSETWKAMPFRTFGPDNGSHISELRVTDRETPYVQVEGECLILRGAHADAVAVLCETMVPSNATAEQLDAVFQDWKDFIFTTSQKKQLADQDQYLFIEDSEQERKQEWIRFLTVCSDQGEDPDRHSYSARRKVKKNKPKEEEAMSINDILVTAESELRDDYYLHHVNLKLSRAYLLPSKSTKYPISLHPNRRIHAGMRANGPGRRLCITKRGFIALVPADTEIEDSIAILRGASFPYILRKYGGKKRHVLVGEAFVPRYARGMGEELAKREFKIGLNAIIRLY